MRKIIPEVCFVLALAAVAAVALLYPVAVRADDLRTAAVTQCMEGNKSDVQVSNCIMGVVALAAIERSGGTAGTVVLPQAPPQQQVGRTAWDVFASIVLGVTQFVKETVQTVGPIAGQVYVARSNNDVQKVVAGYNRETQIATVNAFTTMGAHVRDAGIAGYPYVQAPGAVTTTTSTLSGTGVQGSGTYTGPVTPTDSHNNPAPVVVTCIGTPPVCTR